MARFALTLAPLLPLALTAAAGCAGDPQPDGEAALAEEAQAIGAPISLTRRPRSRCARFQ